MAQIEGAEELSVWFQTLSIHWNEAIGTENSTQYLLRFLQDAKRLFTVQGEGLEILRLCSRNEGRVLSCQFAAFDIRFYVAD